MAKHKADGREGELPGRGESSSEGVAAAGEISVADAPSGVESLPEEAGDGGLEEEGAGDLLDAAGSPPEASDEDVDDGSPHFHLSFVARKAYVGFTRRRINAFVEARNLALEVPEVTFPFDVTGGADRFRHRRCRLVRLSFFADRAGLEAEILRRLDPARSGFADLQIAVGDGFIELAGTAPAGEVGVTGNDPSAPGARVPFTLKLGFDASADWAVRIVVHDVRLYAPSALAAPALGVALLEAFDPSGLPLELRPPALAVLQPVPAYIRALMPRHGWKLPEMRGMKLTKVITDHEGVGLVFDAAKEAVAGAPQGATGQRAFLSALEGAREYGEAEGALAAGHTRAACDLYLELAGPLPEHPFAAERLMGLLVADPAQRDAARDLAEAWLEREPRSGMALWTRAVTLATTEPAQAARAFLRLSELASDQGEPLGTLQAAAAAGRLAARAADVQTISKGDDAQAARALSIEAFERVLRVAPGHREALDALSTLYRDAADPAAAITSLERLLGVTPEAGARALLHLSIARLQAGTILPADGAAAFSPSIARAKLHFDAALRDDPELAGAWLGLGRACAVEGDALRAVRCLDEAKQRLIDRRCLSEAAAVAFEIAELWDTALEHPENALLRYAQAVDLEPGDLEARRRHADLCLRTGRRAEAETSLRELVERLDLTGGDPRIAQTARQAHLALAKIAREDHDDLPAARRHLEVAGKLCELAPDAAALRGIAREEVEVCELLGEEAALALALERLAGVSAAAEAATFLIRAARLRLGAGETESARALLGVARTHAPELAETFVVLAEVEAASGDAAAEALALESLLALQRDPDEQARSLRLLAGLYSGLLGRRDDAVAALEGAHELATELQAQIEASRKLLLLAREDDEPPQLADALMRLSEDLAAGDEIARIEAAEARQEEARIRLGLGDAHAALAVLTHARELTPRSAKLCWQLASIHLELGDAAAAHLCFLDFIAAGGAEAAGLDPIEVSRTLGQTALTAGEDEAAATHLLAAHRAAPGELALALQVAGLLATVGRPADEAEVLRRLAVLHADAGDTDAAVESWIGAAQGEHEAGADPARVAGAFAQALDLALSEEAVAWTLDRWAKTGERPVPPDSLAELWTAADGLYGLAREIEAPSLAARALGVLAALSETAREASGTLERVADLQQQQGDRDAVLDALSRAVRLAPARRALRERHAEVLAESDPERALAAYETLLDQSGVAKMDPPDLETERRCRHRAGELALLAGLPDRAAHHLGIYLAHNPADEEVLLRQAKLLEELEAWGDLYALRLHQAGVLESRVSIEEGCGARDGAVEAYAAAAGIALDHLQRTDLAREALEASLGLFPTCAATIEALLGLLDLSRPGEASQVAHLRGLRVEALEDPDRRAEAGGAWAEALLAAGEPARALVAYREALALCPDDPALLDGLAVAAWQAGEVEAFLDAAEVCARRAVIDAAPDAGPRLLAVARALRELGAEPARQQGLLQTALSPQIACTLTPAERVEARRARLGLSRDAEHWSSVEEDLSALLEGEDRLAGAHRYALLIERGMLREDELGDLDGAREDYAAADRLAPDAPGAFDRLLALCRGQGDTGAVAALLIEKAHRSGEAAGGEAVASMLLEASALLLGSLSDPERAARVAAEAREASADPAVKQQAFALEAKGLREAGRSAESRAVSLAGAALLDAQAAEACLLELATEASRDGDAPFALRVLREARARAPQSLLVAAALLERLFLAGALEEASTSARLLAAHDLDALGETLDIDRHEAFELLRLAARVLAAGDDPEAQGLLEALFADRPGDDALCEALERRLHTAGDAQGIRVLLETHHAALQRLEGAGRRGERTAHLARRIADLCAEFGDHEAEVRWLQAAGLEGAADFERTLRLQLARGDIAGAREAGRALIETLRDEGDHPAAALALARVSDALLAHGRSEEALELLACFPRLRRRHREALFAWVRVAEFREDRAEQIAAHEAHAAFALDEADDPLEAAEAVAVVAQLEEAGADPATALLAWMRALELGDEAGDDPDAQAPRLERARHALTLAETLKDAEAMADLHERLLRRAKTPQVQADHLLALARLHRDAFDAPEQARAAFEAVLERRPDDAQARDALQAVLETLGDHAALAAFHARRAQEAQTSAMKVAAWLEAAAAERACEATSAERKILETIDALDPEALAAEGLIERLDELQEAAGEDHRRAERRILRAEALPADDAAREGLLLEAAELFRDRVHDDAAARDALLAAFEVQGSQAAAQGLRELLAKHEDHRGLADLASRQASRTEGPMRAGLLRSAGDLLRDEVNDLDAALMAYREALQATPADAVIAARVEDLLRRQGRPSPLAAHLRARLPELEAKGDAEATRELLREIAGLEAEAGDRDAQLAALLEAEVHSPDDLELQGALLEAFDAVGRSDEAIVCRERLFASDPRDRSHFGLLHTHYLGKPLARQRPLVEILLAHAATLEEGPERDGLEREALEILASVGDRSALTALVRELRKRHPRDDELLEILLDAAREDEDLSTLRALLEEGVLFARGRAEVVFLLELAQVLQALDDLPAALDALATLCDLRPQVPGVLVEAILLAEQLGDEACRAFDGRLMEAVDRGEAVAPELEARTRMRLSARALRAGDEAGALDHLRAAGSLTLDDEMRSQVHAAVSHLARAVRVPTVKADAHALLAASAPAEQRQELLEAEAEAREASGEKQAAQTAWRALFDLDPAHTRAFEALVENHGELGALRSIYQRHIEAISDRDHEGALLLGLADLCEAAGESGVAADANLAAWALEPGDPERCLRALPILRARRHEDDGAPALDRALAVLRTGARPRERLGYTLEAMEALAEGGQNDLARVRASQAIELAEAESIWDEEVEARVRLLVELLRDEDLEPHLRAQLLALEARSAPLAYRGEALLQSAKAWRAAGDVASAITTLGESLALAATPGSEAGGDQQQTARRALVEIHLDQEDYTAAVSQLLAIAAQGSTLEAAAQPAIEALHIRDERLKVAHLYNHLIAAEPHDRALAARAAEAWQQAGDSARTLELLEWLFQTSAAVGEDPAAQAARALAIARIHADADDMLRAAESWSRALERDPLCEEAFEALVEFTRSRKDHEALSRLTGDRADALAAAGEKAAAEALRIEAVHAALEAGDTARGKSILDEVLAHNPAHPEANAVVAQLAHASGDIEAERGALAARLAGAQEPVERAAAALALGRLEQKAGDVAAATSVLRVAYATAMASADPEAQARPTWADEAIAIAAPELARMALATDQAEAALSFIDVAREVGVSVGAELSVIEGRAALATGAHDRARACFEHARGDAHLEQMALKGLLQIAAAEGDLRGELAIREQLAAMGSADALRASVWLDLAERAHAAGESELGYTAEQQALVLDPGSSAAFVRKHAQLVEREDLDGLAELLRARARHAENVDDRAQAFLELGLLCRDRLGRGDDAIDAFERAVGIDPTPGPARAALAEALFAAGRRAESKSHFEVIAAGLPELPAFVVALRLAEIAEGEGEPVAALAAFKAATEINAAFLPAWEGVVRLAEKGDDLEQQAWALEGLLGALPMEESSGRVQAMKALGIIERHQLHNERAIDLFEEALELAASDSELLSELAEAYEAQGRHAELRDTLQKLAGSGLAPDEEAFVLVRLAEVLLDRFADVEAALPVLEKATRADPGQAKAWERLLELVAPREDASRMARVARHLLELGRGSALLPYRLEAGRALLATGHGAFAADLLVGAARERPDDRQLIAEAAAAACLAGKDQEAVDLMVGLAERTGEPSDLRAAADAALMAGDARLYVELLWRGLDEESMDPEVRALAARGLSWVMADQLGDPDAAADGLLTVAAERPEDRALQRDLATLLDSAGRSEEALDLWRSIALRDPTDQLALGRMARLLEAASSTRSAFVRGLAAFIEGESPRAEGVALAGVEVSYLTRNDLAVAEAAHPVAWFFRAMAPVLEPLFPTDLSPYGVDALAPLDPETSPLAARALELASVLTDREFQIFRSEILGFAYRLENTRPVSIMLGRAVAEATPGALDQVLIRAIDLLGAGYALPSKFAPDDLTILVRLAASFFDPGVSVQIPADKLTQYHQAMRVLCPDELKWKLMPLAKEAIAALDFFDPHRFGPALHRTGDRVALLVTGDVSGALAARLKLDGHETEGDGVRERALVEIDDLRDLALFLLRDDIDRLWSEVQRR